MARRNIKSFKYQSEVASNGKGRYYLPGVPRRDLDERDIARLSDEDYEAVKSAKQPNGSALYVRSDKGGEISVEEAAVEEAADEEAAAEEESTNDEIM
jgi:hypothetical protein